MPIIVFEVQRGMSTRTQGLVVLMARPQCPRAAGRKQGRRMQHPMWSLGCADEYRMVAARQDHEGPLRKS